MKNDKELTNNENAIITAKGIPVISPSEIPLDYTKIDNSVMTEIANNLGATALGVFAYICNLINPNTKIAEISFKELSTELKISDKTVSKIIHELENLNQIIIIEKGKSHSKTKLFITAYPKSKYPEYYDKITIKEVITQREMIFENTLKNENDAITYIDNSNVSRHFSGNINDHKVTGKMTTNLSSNFGLVEKVSRHFSGNSSSFFDKDTPETPINIDTTDSLKTINNNIKTIKKTSSEINDDDEFLILKKEYLKRFTLALKMNQQHIDSLTDKYSFDIIFNVLEYIYCKNKYEHPNIIVNPIGYLYSYLNNPASYDIEKYKDKTVNDYKIKKKEQDRINKLKEESENNINKINDQELQLKYNLLDRKIQESLKKEFEETKEYKKYYYNSDDEIKKTAFLYYLSQRNI